MDLESHLAFRPLDHAADFEAAPGAVFEFSQRSAVVLVGHRFAFFPGTHRKMRAFARRSDGTIFDEQCLLPYHPAYGSGEHVGHIDDVGHEVTQGAAACFRSPETPGKHAVGMTGVTCEEPTAIMRDVSQYAFGDEASGMLHEGRPTVIVADPGQHAGFRGRTGDFVRFLRGSAHGLFTEDMLAGRGGGADHFQVEMIGRGDVYYGNTRVVHHLAPVRRGTRETHGVPGLLAPSGYVVGTNDQVRVKSAFRESLPDLEIGPAVYGAHPAHTDDSDADLRGHAFRSILGLSRRSGQGVDQLMNGQVHEKDQREDQERVQQPARLQIPDPCLP